MEVEKNKSSLKDRDFALIQAMVPRNICNDVRRKVERECGYMATYFRKWIIEGYTRDKEKGEF